MFKIRKKIVFKTHPFIRGHAQLSDQNDQKTVLSYGGSTSINSAQFEELQRKMKKDNIDCIWQTM